jgi:beta-mannosidase
MINCRISTVYHNPVAAPRDLLAGASWECTNVAPGKVDDPNDLTTVSGWIPAPVPGSAVAALRDAGQWAWTDDDQELLDGRDWWFRVCPEQQEGPGPWQLELDGLATLADVWVDGVHVLHSENMFMAHRVTVPSSRSPSEVVVRCAALAPVLLRSRPRPRWRSQLVRSQNMRWIRTTPLGRIPGWSFSGAPVGPWRPVRLYRLGGPRIVQRDLWARSVVEGNEVEVRVRWVGDFPGACSVQAGGATAELDVLPDEEGYLGVATLQMNRVERWWPHTHGEPVRYQVMLVSERGEEPLGDVGFRDVEVDRASGGFTLLVNGVEVFCRGACWVPPDATGFTATAGEIRRSLVRMRDAGMNMVRVGGHTTYEDSAFWDVCDELGLMVWQDCMLASVDPPEDATFLDGLRHELNQVFTGLRAHPALAVVSGSSEIHQQAAMFGVALDGITCTAIDRTIPEVAARLLPGIPYLPSSPTGGDLPFDPSRGVGHYFGVGAYQRPPEDARRSGVRFAAECLAFAIPPERVTLERFFGDASVVGHHPRWKRGVARDSGTPWDFEDVRDHYVRLIFGVDPYRVRYEDPERALDLGRAVVAELMTRVMGEWRQSSSGCAGALILDWQDIYPGAGWGLLDVSGLPKAPWYPLARILAPVAVTLSDEGLAGLTVHVFNDRPNVLQAEVVLRLFTQFGSSAEQATERVEIAPRSEFEVSAARMLNGFRDLTNSYRFGPPAFDVVLVELHVDGVVISSDIHLPGGAARRVETDLGLSAEARSSDGQWEVLVRTERFAQWVRLDIPGFVPADSWFHLAPGTERVVGLAADVAGDRPPRGQVGALNLASCVAVKLA